MVSQRRERERQRRKHSNDHGQEAVAVQPCSLCRIMRHFHLTVSLSWLLCLCHAAGGRQNGYSARPSGRGGQDYDSCSSFMSSELESTSCFDSEDDDATSRSDVPVSSSLSWEWYNPALTHTGFEYLVWICINEDLVEIIECNVVPAWCLCPAVLNDPVPA